MAGVAQDILVGVGVALLLLCSLGMLLMRSAYDRLHYVSAGAWGVLLLAGAIAVKESLSLIGDKALATAFVLVVSGPAVVHATARAARISERGRWNAPPGRRGDEKREKR